MLNHADLIAAFAADRSARHFTRRIDAFTEEVCTRTDDGALSLCTVTNTEEGQIVVPGPLLTLQGQEIMRSAPLPPLPTSKEIAAHAGRLVKEALAGEDALRKVDGGVQKIVADAVGQAMVPLVKALDARIEKLDARVEKL